MSNAAQTLHSCRSDSCESLDGKSIGNVDEYRSAIKEQDLSRGIRMQIKSEGVRRFLLMKGNE